MITTSFTSTFEAIVPVAGVVSELAATSLSGGGVAVLGNDGSGNIAGAIFDENGVQTGSFTAQGSNGSITQLTNGNLAITSQGTSELLLKIVDPAGAVVVDTFGAVVGASNPKVISLSGDRFAVFYEINQGNGDIDLYFSIYGNDGALVSFAPLVSSTAPEYGISAAQMSDGNIAMAWTQTNGARTEIWTAVIDSSGTTFLSAPSVFDDTGTTNRDVSLTATANGFAIAYTGRDAFSFVTVTQVASLDFTANLITATEISSITSLTRPELTELADGTLACVHLRDFSGSRITLFGLLSPDLSSLNQGGLTIAFDPEVTADSVIAPLGTGTFAIFGAQSSGLSQMLGEVRLLLWNMIGDGDDDSALGSSFYRNFIQGNGGNDTLTGNLLNDTIEGNSGNDSLTGGAGVDSLNGGEGNDVLSHFGGDANEAGETYDGGADFDVLVLTGLGTLVHDFSDDTLNSIEQVELLDSDVGGIRTLILNASQFGSGIASDATFIFDGFNDNSEVVQVALNGATSLDLSGLTFSGITGTARFEITGGTADETILGTAIADFIFSGGGNDTIASGAGNDEIKASSGNHTLDGGQDIDTLNFGPFSSASVNISLAITGAQSFGGSNFTISNFENLIGSAQSDILTGSSGDNFIFGNFGFDTLNGGAGNDTLVGASGNDVFDGGANNDVVDYSLANVGVRVDLSNAAAQNTNWGTDRFVSIETIIGSGFNDTLTGSTGANTLLGGAGNDSLVGGGGSDSLDGGTGNDRMLGGVLNDNYFVDSVGDIVTELSGEGTLDTVRTTLNTYTLPANVERVIFVGSGNFVGLGNSGANQFNGNSGDDRFVDVLGGNDTISAGAGSDSMDFRSSTIAAIINLATGFHFGAATGDVYSSIEKFFGSNTAGDTMTAGTGRANFSGFGGNDTLTGGNNIDVLQGNAGNDSLNGAGGIDNLDGGAGNDTLTGGSGKDIFIFSAAGFGQDIITDFEEGSDRLKVHSSIANNIAAFSIVNNGTTSVVLTQISSPANTITLQGASAINITAADFLFY